MNKIYIGNLPYSISEQDIESTFEKFGDIDEVALIRDRDTKRLKGFGFVTFKADTAAQEALQMDGQDFHGRPLKVNLAREKKSRW